MNATDEIVAALRLMLPRAEVLGQSFADELPPYRLSSTEQRLNSITTARSATVQRLLSRANVKIERDEERVPIWPEGFVGSVTHKGTIVLAAVAHADDYTALGIDLERRDRTFGTHAGRVAPEGLPPVEPESDATLITFCAKEAIYKAVYNFNRQRLRFGDIRLEWTQQAENRLSARATSPTPTMTVHCAWVRDWLLAAAYPSTDVWNSDAVAQPANL